MLSQESAVEFITAGDTESLSSAFDEFVGVEASGWKGRTGTAIRADRRLMGFYRSLIDGFMPIGGVRINLLRVDGQCIAGQFCLKVDRSLYSLKIGYREDFSRLSPGNMLLEHVLKREFATGDVDAVDLITGAPWQRHWRPQTRKLFTAYAFNRTVRGGMSFRISRAKEHLRPTYQRYIKPLLLGQARRAGEATSGEV
jgi:CelD/BcsL family acetyltransferase involved in cellulose biosynthesis